MDNIPDFSDVPDDKVKEDYPVHADGVEARIKIFQRKKDYVPVYAVSYPHVEEPTKAVLDDIREEVTDKIDVGGREILDPKSMENIKSKFLDKSREIIKKHLPDLTGERLDTLAGRLVHEMYGLGRVEILLNDDELEEIVINSSEDPIWVYHKGYGWLKTDLNLESEEEIYKYSSIIGRRVGKQITNLKPLMDAHLTTGDRVNATLFPISTQGNTITIRKFARNPWTITHFIDPELGTLSKEIAALLWLSIQYEMNTIIAGGTASGKCLVGQERVFTQNGKEPIKELVERSFEAQEPEPTDDGYLLRENPLDLEVFSLDTDQAGYEGKKVRAFWKREAPDTLYKVKTNTGRKVTVTPEHPFISLHDGIGKIRADELQAGDWIAVPRQIELEGESFPISEKVKEMDEVQILSRDETHLKVKTPRGKPVKIPLQTSPEMLEVIGYILGDGNLSRNGYRIKFTNSEDKLLVRFKRLFERCFDKKAEIKRRKERTDGVHVHSKALVQVLNEVFEIPRGKKAQKIELPSEFHSLPKGELKGLLRAMYDCDSSFHPDKGVIEYSTASERLAEDLMDLLQRLGIVGRRRTKTTGGNEYQRVSIAGLENAEEFKEKIGYSHPEKKRRLEDFLQDNESCSPNLDLVPANKLISDLKERLRMHDREIADKTSLKRHAVSRYMKGDRVPTRDSLRELSEVFEERSEELRQLKKELDWMEAEIEKIPDREEVLELSTKLLNPINMGKREALQESGLGNSTFWEWETREPQWEKLRSFARTTLSGYRNFRPALQDAQKPDEYLELGFKRKGVAERMNLNLDTFYHKFRGGNGFKQSTVPHFREIQTERLGKLEELKSDVERLEELLEREPDLQEIYSRTRSIRKNLKISSQELEENTGVNPVPYELDPTTKTTKERLTKLADYLKDSLNSALAGEVKGDIDLLKNLSVGGIFWDKVTEVKKTEPEDKWVYDLTVEPNHNFVANGITVHNTALLNTLTPFIPPTQRIITIEDTRELNLPNFLHWVPMTTREPNPEGKGEVKMLDLMVNSLRMRPDRIIVGEIRRKRQAEVLFEAMLTGHSVYSTLHANTAQEVKRRMTNPPIEVPESMLEALHLTSVQYRDRRTGIRRTRELAEVIPKTKRKGEGVEVETNVIYRWRPESDSFFQMSESERLMDEIKSHTGMNDEEVQENLKEKQNVLQWFLDHDLKTVNSVGKIVADYYRDKERVLELMREDKPPDELLEEDLIQELKRRGYR